MVLNLATNLSYLTCYQPLFNKIFSLVKSTETVFNLSIFNSSTSDVKVAKSAFLARICYQHLLFFKSDFVI